MGKKVYAVIAAIMVTALIMHSASTSNTAYAYFGDAYSEEQSKESTLEEVLKLAEDRVTSVESQLGHSNTFYPFNFVPFLAHS